MQVPLWGVDEVVSWVTRSGFQDYGPAFRWELVPCVFQELGVLKSKVVFDSDHGESTSDFLFVV